MAKYYTLEANELHPTQELCFGAWVALTDAAEVEGVMKQVSPTSSVSAALHLGGKDINVILTDKCVMTVSETGDAVLEACMKDVVNVLFVHANGTENTLPDMMDIFGELSSVEMVANEYASAGDFVSALSADDEIKGVFTIMYARAEALLDVQNALTSDLEKAFPKAKLLWAIVADDSVDGVRSVALLGR